MREIACDGDLGEREKVRALLLEDIEDEGVTIDVSRDDDSFSLMVEDPNALSEGGWLHAIDLAPGDL